MTSVSGFGFVGAWDLLPISLLAGFGLDAHPFLVAGLAHWPWNVVTAPLVH